MGDYFEDELRDHPKAWITHKLYVDRDAALADARRAAGVDTGTQYYIVEMSIDERFRQYWSYPTHWSIRSNKPFQPVTDRIFLEECGCWILICEFNPEKVVLQPSMF